MKTRFIRFLAVLLCFAMLLPYIPGEVFAADGEFVSNYSSVGKFKGKTLSVLGDSISTFDDYSNGTAANTTNSTIANNIAYYHTTTVTSYGVDAADTWWNQTVEALGMKLLVNNSWSGSCVLNTAANTVGAYIDRCKQLHDNTGSNSGQTPDIIAVYLGTNDMKNAADPGDVTTLDYTKLKSVASGHTPTSIFEAYALMLYRMIKKYPKAEIYCFTLLPYLNMTSAQKSTMKEFNEGVKVIAEHYGVGVVDLYSNSGMTSDPTCFAYHMANRLHPSAGGMDAITNCFISTLLKESQYSDSSKIHNVTYSLNNAFVENGKVMAAVEGMSFCVDVATKKGYKVKTTVTMDGVDITSTAVKGNTITVANPTGDIRITAKGNLDTRAKVSYRWELASNALRSVNDNGAIYNHATLTAGSCTGNVFTDAQHKLEKPILLSHTLPWVIEWKSSGEWAGSLLLAGASNGNSEGDSYIYRRPGSDLIAIGYYTGTQYRNYGVNLSDHGIDGTASHVYRLVNEINADGSNMVYLYVDNTKLGAMNHYHIGGTSQNTTSNWLNGRDLVFSYMGTSSHPISNCTINYIQVWEKGIEAHDFNDYRWETSGSAFNTITGNGLTSNKASKKAGSIATDGKLTGTYFTLNKPVVLMHDEPWSVEWKSSGNWKDTANGGFLFSASNTSNAPFGAYLYRRGGSDIIAFGERNGSHLNYGISLADHGIDGTATHTYRLTNRVNANGSNMVYLYVDGVELGAMNNYFVGGTAQGTTSNWVSGRDFTFTQIGTSQFTVGGCYLHYVQVWERGIQPENYRWEVQNDAWVSVTSDTYAKNTPKVLSGSISSGKFTGSQFKLDKTVVLRHDKAWNMEWKSSGNWKDVANGALLMSSDPVSSTDGTVYLYRRHASNFIALGVRANNKHNNYGVMLSDYGIDGSAEHTYRLSNRVAADGSNMIYLYVDDVQISAMDTYYVGGATTGTASTALSGMDFAFAYMGTSDFTIGNCYLEYLQIWEDGTEFYDYRWETQNDVLTSLTTDTFTENTATLKAGSISDGTYTGGYFGLDKSVTLLHDRPWSIEWQSAGSWSNDKGGALLLSGSNISGTEGNKFIYRRKNSTLIGLGTVTGGKYYNYGIQLADHGIDGTARHIYRLTNRPNADGSNMVYLYVDGKEIGPMNGYHIGGTAQGTTDNWVSGQDFVFSYVGTEGHTINDCSLDYLQIWENCMGTNNYRWEPQNDVLTDITTDGNSENEMTAITGGLIDGVFDSAQYKLNTPMMLHHDTPWVLEWQSEGTWRDTAYGALMFSSGEIRSVDGLTYIYRRGESSIIAMGEYDSGYRNYGLDLSAYGIDGTAPHVYALVNRLHSDGSNMVYLYVDGMEVGPMDNYYSGSTNTFTKSDWISGKDFSFAYLGNNDFFIGNCSMDYIQVWEGGAPDGTIQFQNEDGTVLSTATYAYGESVTAPAKPTKADDETYTYTFAGWDKTVTACTGDAVYTATYTATYKAYTVTFRDWDGTVLSATPYHYGDTPAVPETPTRADDSGYAYTFAGWDKEILTVTEDAVYTATYTGSYIDYLVRFLDFDGTVLSEGSFHYGDTVTVPADPTRGADETYTYTFAGWDKEVTAVTGNTDYTAQYTPTYIAYTVAFYDWDGTLLSQSDYYYGDTVVIPANPARNPDETYTYAFAGWDKAVTTVAGNADYTAQYTPTYIDYTVTFRNWDGTVLSETVYHYGDTVKEPAQPVKAGNGEYRYLFNGWDKTVTTVTGDTVYTANFTQAYVDYTVTFRDYNGVILSTATYHYGEPVTEPQTPVRSADAVYCYTFAGWNKTVTPCKGDAVYTATYTKDYVNYTVAFHDWDGTVLWESTYHYGDTVVVPVDPVRNGDETYHYNFAGWNGTVTPCYGDMVYTATYTATYVDYTVTFRDWDGTVLSEETYHYGETVTRPSDPVRQGEGYVYTFTGWSSVVTPAVADVTYTACYEETMVLPTITPKYPSLSFEDEVIYNVYFALTDTVNVCETGIMLFDREPENGTVANATEILPNATLQSNGLYKSETKGVPAKKLGDRIYFKVYTKLVDGSYQYSNLLSYSAVDYAMDRLANSSDTKLKQLCVAMLNYGAAAQTYLDYRTDSLMNACLTDNQLAMAEDYRAEMVAPVGSVDSGKAAQFVYNGGFTNRYPSVSFESALCISYLFHPAHAVDGDMTLYYWTVNDYLAVGELTTHNATGSLTMTVDASGFYKGTIEGISAKAMDNTIYAVGVYTCDGVTYTTGVLPYSVGAYCMDRIAKGSQTMQAFAAATAVYGYYAKEYFAA